MKFFSLICLFSCAVFAADWKEKIAELAPDLVIEVAHNISLSQELQKSFEKNSAVAFPFKSPVGSIRFVQDKGVRTPENSAPFKQGVHHQGRDFAVYRYSTMAPKDLKILAKIQNGKLFKTYLNGKSLAQHENGMLYHRESPYETLSLRKGRNDLVFISITKDHHIPHLRTVPCTDKVIESFYKYLDKFEKIKQQDLEEWLGIQLALRNTGLIDAQVHGLNQIVDLNYSSLPQGRIRHFFHLGIDPRVMAQAMRKIDTQKLVDLMIAINHTHTKSYFDVLAIEGRGREIVNFFKLYAKKYKPNRGHSWGNNLYAIAEFLNMQGDSKSAHEMFLLFDEIIENKNSSTKKKIQYALLETQDDSGIRPRFTADPEVEVYVNDLERLFNQKADRDTLAQIYKIIRGHQDKLFNNDYQLYSIKTYFQQKLSGNSEFAEKFAVYLRERYKSRIAKAIDNFDIDELQDYLRETSGLASFPEAEALLMQEYYNRGDHSLARAYAGRLLQYADYAKQAAAYLLIIEGSLETPEELRHQFSNDLLGTRVQFKGQSIQLKELAAKSLPKASSSKGPGSLISKIPLSADLKSTIDGRTSQYDWDQYFINRSQCKLVYNSGKWFSSSPMGTVVTDSKGQQLWSTFSFTLADTRIQNAPRSFKGAVINNSYYNLNYNGATKSYALQKRNLQGDLQWDSSYLKSFENWEPCSIPYSKMGSHIILLVEKDRQAAPVFAVAFIDLQSGEIESVKSLAKIRDPFKEEGHYDIFRSLLQYDNFCDDSESIYLHSGSGLVVKVNAYEKRIEWVRSYTYKTRKGHEGDSFDWTNPARTASPYIGIIKDKLIHFDNATMSWYALKPETGKILWKNSIDLPTYIHSRNADEILFSYLNKQGQHILKSLSLGTGRVMWQQSLGNLSVRGEGTIKNSKLYIPVKRGIVSFDLKKKELVGRKLLNISPSAIDSHKDNFLLYTDTNAFLLAADDQLPSKIDDEAQSKNITFEQADDVDLRFFSNDGLIPFPITDIYFKERPVAHSLDNSAYSLIQYLSDYILIKEATLVNGEYSPSRLLWQKRMPNFQLKGTKILNYSSGSVEIMDAYTLQSEFTYNATNGEVIYAARWSDDKLYILSSNGFLKQIDYKSKKLIKEFQLYARNFVVLGNRLLTFPHNHSHKNKVYEITDRLNELKTLDKAYRIGEQLQGNSFAKGWLTHGALHVFDFKQLKMHQKKMGYTPHRSWRLCEKYAAENFGEFLDLSNGTSKKHSFNLLGNKGSIYGQGNDYYYASSRGLMKLERFTDKITVFDDHLTKAKKVVGWCREVGDQLIVCSSKMRNVYDLKSGELISRQSIDGPPSKKTILTDQSLIKVHNGNAYLYNSLKLSNEAIAHSSAKIDSLFWQKVDQKFWHGKKGFPVPQVEYRLSDSSNFIHLQLRVKGHEKFINHLGLSFNSHRFYSAFFAEFTEKGSNIGHMLGSKLKEPFKHYFSADGYEYMELKVEKPDALNNAFDGVMSFELSLLDQGNKVGSMRFGSTYQPNTSYRENTYATRSYKCMDTERYSKFEKLYAEAKELLTDGESLSQFIKARRTHHSISSNVMYLEKLLTRHSKSIQSHNILAVLFIEYLKSLRAFDFTDDDLRKAYSHCKSLADKLGIKSYERALSFCVLNFNRNDNPFIQPTRAKLVGRGGVYLDITGRLQFSVSDGRIALPLGFFGEQLKELDRLELESPRRFKPALGSVALFHKGNLTPVIDSQGKPQSGLKENNWKDAHESLFNFYGPKRLMSWYPKTQRIRVHKIAFDSLETNYNWDESSLLLNLTCNPINRWRADEMLTKYIELKGSSDLVELCAEILANDPNNEYLLEALLNKYGENAGKDLKKYQSLMSKARVPINLRKSMSLELFPDKDWLQLGPINLEENKTELLQKPEENFNLSAFKLSNKKELKFEAPRDNGKDYEGFMYLRKDFNSSSSSNAYLHIKPENRRTAFNNLRIWHNGKVLSDTIVNTDKNQTTTLKIPLRKGKNSLLIKYSFEHYTNLKLRLGNVYGADLSYIKPIKILPDTIVSTSSEEIAYLKTSNVFDGNLETRWSSKYKFPQFLCVNLPKTIKIKDIEVFWQVAFAKKYTIKVSENGIDWKLVYTKEGKKTKDNDQISFNNFHLAKYVRFDFLEKGTQYGASIYEIKFNKKFLHELVPSFIKSEISYNSNSVKLN